MPLCYIKKLIRICTLHSQLCPRDLTPGFLVDGFTPRCASTYSATAFYISIIRVTYNFPIWTVQASARCGKSRVSFLVVACLALIEESLRVQADVRIVAVDVVQPYGMVYDLPRLVATHLTEPAIHSQPLCYESIPCAFPCSAFIKLFLCQCLSLQTGKGQLGRILASQPKSADVRRYSIQKNKKSQTPLPSFPRYYYITILCTILFHVSCNSTNVLFFYYLQHNREWCIPFFHCVRFFSVLVIIARYVLILSAIDFTADPADAVLFNYL